METVGRHPETRSPGTSVPVRVTGGGSVPHPVPRRRHRSPTGTSQFVPPPASSVLRRVQRSLAVRTPARVPSDTSARPPTVPGREWRMEGHTGTPWCPVRSGPDPAVPFPRESGVLPSRGPESVGVGEVGGWKFERGLGLPGLCRYSRPPWRGGSLVPPGRGVSITRQGTRVLDGNQTLWEEDRSDGLRSRLRRTGGRLGRDVPVVGRAVWSLRSLFGHRGTGVSPSRPGVPDLISHVLGVLEVPGWCI